MARYALIDTPYHEEWEKSRAFGENFHKTIDMWKFSWYTFTMNTARLGASAFYYDDLSAEVALSTLANQGFRVIELICDPPQAYPSDLSAARRQEIRRLAATMGVTLSLHTPIKDLNPAASNPRVRAICRAEYQETIHLAADLGADTVVVHTGYKSLFTVPPEEAYAVALDTLAAVAQEAEKLGVVLAVENVGIGASQFLITPADHAALVDKLDSRAVVAAMDVGHSILMGWQPVEHAQALGGRLRYIHLQDGSGRSDDHLPLGDGVLDLRSFFQQLSRGGFDGRFIIEAHPGALARGNLMTSVCYVEDLCDDVGLAISL